MSISNNGFPEQNSSSDPSLSETEPTPAPSPPRPLTQEDLPPEAQGEQNGGPLGCCLGIMVGVLLSLAIGIISRFYPGLFISIFGSQLSLVTRLLMFVVLFAAAVLFGSLGWRLGKRFYREYEPSPRYVRKMAELEARQQAIERRRRRQNKQKSPLS